MNLIERQPVLFDRKALDVPGEKDFKELIKETCVITTDGVPRMAYVKMTERLPELVRCLKKIKYDANYRTGGLPTVSRIFGFSPRSTLRKDFCSATSLARDFPWEHKEVCDAGKVAASHYKELNPSLYAKHMTMTEDNVHPSFFIRQTPFTSGIINRNNQLRYHLDSGNYKDVWSCMFVFKSGVAGGYLSVPEYGLGFELADHSLFMFDGQGLLHGVTPIHKFDDDAYRFSIVYYSLRQMWNCLPVEEEIQRIRKLRTEREVRRARA